MSLENEVSQKPASERRCLREERFYAGAGEEQDSADADKRSPREKSALDGSDNHHEQEVSTLAQTSARVDLQSAERPPEEHQDSNDGGDAKKDAGGRRFAMWAMRAVCEHLGIQAEDEKQGEMENEKAGDERGEGARDVERDFEQAEMLGVDGSLNGWIAYRPEVGIGLKRRGNFREWSHAGDADSDVLAFKNQKHQTR
jgi:hypothetical protein